MPGFKSFFMFFASFCKVKLATSSRIVIKKDEYCYLVHIRWRGIHGFMTIYSHRINYPTVYIRFLL